MPEGIRKRSATGRVSAEFGLFARFPARRASPPSPGRGGFPAPEDAELIAALDLLRQVANVRAAG
jgi:hypothetical protein